MSVDVKEIAGRRPASRRQWNAWQRRAETLNQKAHDLLAEMLLVLGSEHEATNFADNIVHATEGVLGWTDRTLAAHLLATEPTA